MLGRPISISFAPNFEVDDVKLALRLLLGLSNKTELSQAPAKLKKALEKIFPGQQSFLFSSGRSSLYYSLMSLGLSSGDEVILQAFTCVAVPNAITWAGFTPVFVDIGPSFNLDPQDLQRKITPKTKAIIVQHTFGIPADMEKINEIAQKHNLLVVEDCAHALGGTYKNKALGEWGDVAILSFGRDKMISSVFGGAAISSKPHIQKKLQEYEEKLGAPPRFFALQQLLYLIIYAISLPFYNVLIGKIFLRLMRSLGLLSRAVYPQERGGQMTNFIETRVPDSLAALALHQLAKLDRFSKHRTMLATFYIEKLSLDMKAQPYLRVPLVVHDKAHFLRKAQATGLHLGNWYRAPIDPPGSSANDLVSGCPNAAQLAQTTINLPTHINTSLQDAEKIVTFVLQNTNGK